MSRSNIPQYNIVHETRQSPRLDLSAPLKIDPTFIKDKTILITGGASGLGAGFFELWASYGANIIIGDINASAGEELVAKIRQETQNPNLHFLHLDVTSWQSQVTFFREAANLSTHKGIDVVVANAGINAPKEQFYFESPTVDYQNDLSPPPPPLKTIDVNLTGVLYTSHLALFYLSRNPGSEPCSPTATPGDRDRHLLLLGSVASLIPMVSQTYYGISKHGVLGLFRCLRASAPIKSGVRVNMICPYFIDTPFLSPNARVLLAGAAIGAIQDVVQAATCFLSSPNIVGRAVVVGPKVRLRVPVDEDGALSGASGVPEIKNLDEIIDPENSAQNEVDNDSAIQDRAIWEIYADDFEQVELFNKRIVTVLNAFASAKGWYGWASDLLKLFKRN